MITGLNKKEKITEIFFDEDNPVINIRTYNTDLKNRLTRFSNEHPNECKLVDDSGNGMLEFEINKGRFCFRLTKPYSEERRQTLSRNATQDKHLPRR